MAVGGDDDTIAGAVIARDDAADLPDTFAGRYQIERWLGSGGMGRVYAARDTELDEKVALKVLRSGLSEDALERFRREVRLTRRIQHPNVARMHDIGDYRGDKFLTMELVEGASLLHEIGIAMAWPRLHDLAKQLCAGLAAAHDKGVIHRDLKPANVLIEHATGRAVITDFGIARSADEAGVTLVGSVVGTPRYMSPEQLSGAAVDARADLFSLGVILFELATGVRPWQGDSAVAIAVAQATQHVVPIETTNAPPGFAILVARCLALEPSNRPSTAHALGIELAAIDTVVTGATPANEPRLPHPDSADRRVALAVLPISCAAGDDYLADGVLEDLIDSLSASPGLRVRPAGVVRTRQDPDPLALGRELAVDHVVVGSLRRSPGGLRISARLIGIADEFQIWAQRVEGPESAVLAMSEQLGRGIAAALSTRATTISPRPTDARAVDLYLRARSELRRFWGRHILAAADLLDQAHEISPDSAAIAGARAFASTQAWVMVGEPRFAPRARAAIEHGLATEHPEAYLASASYKFNTDDPIGGATDLATALVRAPMLAQAHEMAGRILVEIDATSEARHHFEIACELDPTRAHIIATDLARLGAIEGDWDSALRGIAAVAAHPDRAIAQLGRIYRARFAIWRNDHAAMTQAAEEFAPGTGGHTSALIALIHKTAVSKTIDVLAWQTLNGTYGGRDMPHRGQLMGLQVLGEIALFLGEHGLAYESIDRADRLGLFDVVMLDRCAIFEAIRDAPRFRAVRERIRARAATVLAAFRAAGG